MHTLYTIDADLKRIGTRQAIYAKQGDACSRKIKISLYSDGNPWTIPTGATAIVRFRKEDGRGGIYDKLGDGATAYEIGGTRGDITITLAPEALTCPGNVLVDVALISGADVIGVFNVVVYVEAAPTAGITPSNNYYNYQTLADINQAIAEAKAAAAGAAKSVNGVKPDASGNITVQIPSSGVTAVNGMRGAVHLAVNALAECKTSPINAVKAVAAVDGFAMIAGAVLAVKFAYSNAAESPRLSYGGAEMPILDRLSGKPIQPGDITAGTYHLQLTGAGWLLLDKQQSEGTTLVPGDKGDDGGYWIPNVAGDGTLTWTPSKEGMGDGPAAANIKGPQGPRGDKGDAGAVGQPGADGTSPTVSVTAINGGHRITITDADGAKTVDVLDGAPGEQGATGPAGQPGAAGPKGDPGSVAVGFGVCGSSPDAATKVVSIHAEDFKPSDGAVLTVTYTAGANTADGPSLSIDGKLYGIIDCNDGLAVKAAAMARHACTYVLQPSIGVAILINPVDTNQAGASSGVLPTYSCSTNAVTAAKVLGGAPEIPATQGYTFYVNFAYDNDAQSPSIVAGNGTYRIAASGREQALYPYNLIAGLHLFTVLSEGWVALLNPHTNTAAMTAAVERGLTT